MICVHQIQTLAYATVEARARRSRHPAHQGPLGESPSTLSFPRGKPVGDVSGVTPKDAASWCRTPWSTLLMSSEGLRPVAHPYFIALGKPCCVPRCQVHLGRGRPLQPGRTTTASCAIARDDETVRRRDGERTRRRDDQTTTLHATA